ncbi:hypothetical protein J6590_102030 [Homalodisca vitripennis]|nr:hypothetical protein J6590_102030 [Homalodisca vitripennis]
MLEDSDSGGPDAADQPGRGGNPSSSSLAAPGGVEWFTRQWNRYDRLVDGFTRQEADISKRALCLAFVRSVLNDEATELLLADVLFRVTDTVTGECEVVLGKEDVTNAKTQMLFFLWSLPFDRWRRTLYDALREYGRRDVRRPVIPFRHFLDATLRNLVRKIVDPLAGLIERWL